MARDLVRLSDVAKAAGVSQGTASNVFSRPDLVRPEVRERVHKTARDLGYAGPDPRGRLLRAGKSNAIGVATAEPLSYFFEDPFARVLMQGISEACDARGAGLALVSARNSERLAWNIQSALVDGFVLLCIENGEKLVELTRERQLPFVALALGKPDDTISAIGVDDYAGAQMAARHLAQLGHRRFGILGLELDDEHEGPVGSAAIAAAIYSTSRDRAYGYFEELALYGIDRGTIPIYETRSTAESVRRGLDYIFSAGQRPTAILAMSDRVAMFALEILAERGLSVPEDISIVGFDGVPEAATVSPPLTTVVQPIAEIGRRAVKTILEHDGGVHRESLPLELLVRKSTAAPRAIVT
ncbi:MAG: LacI family DNA-binding transcriptional regulator [Devosia sp.]|jgi:DNA-binding LacI/PurR family transcriptional regulator|nr:LacI family DNA-binding transcriptional regulator [Devosia sp.]